MGYVVLSRKYRPRSFEEVVGQGHITRTLTRAIEGDRVGQAYIFSGTRGTGKTTMARILSKALNCVEGPTVKPCNKCDICLSVDAGDDVDVIEIDGASHNSVEDVRELRSNAAYRPARARYKIYYIDEVHMLSNAAFNALLKTLEEPPAHVKFIFATTEPHKIPLTIQSRCQRFDFRNLSPEDIFSRLSYIAGEEGIEVEEGALSLLARFASGSMRDAESFFDQVVSFSAGAVTRSEVEEVLGVVPTEALSGLFGALADGNAAGALEGVDGVLSGGTAARQFVAELVDYLRDVLVAKECGADSRLLVRSAGEREILAADGQKWSEEALIYAMQLLSETYARMARAAQSRGVLDVSIIKLSRVEDFLSLKASLDESSAGGGLRPEGGAESNELFESAQGRRAGGGAAAAGSPVEAAVRKEAAKIGNLVSSTLRERASFEESEGVLRIVLPSNFKVQKGHIERESARRALEKAASEAAGRAMRIEVVLRSGVEEPVKDDAGGVVRERALEDPSVKNVLELFGGELVDVEED